MLSSGAATVRLSSCSWLRGSGDLVGGVLCYDLADVPQVILQPLQAELIYGEDGGRMLYSLVRSGSWMKKSAGAR